jgi:hypothetical protein
VSSLRKMKRKPNENEAAISEEIIKQFHGASML